MMVPFSARESNASTQERQYNTFISKKRMAVERTFGKLKQRFNIMEELPCRIRGGEAEMAKDMLHICHLSLVAVSLHNLLRDSDDHFKFVSAQTYRREQNKRRSRESRNKKESRRRMSESFPDKEDSSKLSEGKIRRSEVVTMVSELIRKSKH